MAAVLKIVGFIAALVYVGLIVAFRMWLWRTLPAYNGAPTPEKMTRRQAILWLVTFAAPIVIAFGVVWFSGR